ncbi:hypothetical protein KCU85_g8765, partial [Aureobasidium melanogenum]
MASSAQLLYWPVRTIDGSGNLCNSSVQTQGLPRTGDGPNTFVTGGVTITSPSVGIYMASVSRADGCYTTLASTVVVVPPSEVLSARGARALYDHEPFQYQDLNYHCQPANSSDSWIQDEPGNDCYQQVPAAAYFSGESAFNWDEYYPTSVGPPLTIGPNYRPYILPPASMTDWANSIFSTSGCQIQVDGVWDPPRALVPGTTVLTPVVAWETATSATTTSTSSATPAEVEHSQLAETTASQIITTATAAADNLGSGQTSKAEPSSLTTVIVTSEIRSALSSGVEVQSTTVVVAESASSSATEAQSTTVVTTEPEASSSAGESGEAATPNTARISSDMDTATIMSMDQSSSMEASASSAPGSPESTPLGDVAPVAGSQGSESVITPGRTTELSSTHALATSLEALISGSSAVDSAPVGPSSIGSGPIDSSSVDSSPIESSSTASPSMASSSGSSTGVSSPGVSSSVAVTSVAASSVASLPGKSSSVKSSSTVSSAVAFQGQAARFELSSSLALLLLMLALWL